MKKILWISDLLSSGYGMVSNTIINNLNKTNLYDFNLICINTSVNEKDAIINISKSTNISPEKINVIKYLSLFENENEKNENIRKANNRFFYENIIGLSLINQLVKKIKPDIIFSINDNGILSDHITCIDKIDKTWKFKTIGYIAVDCNNFRHNFFKMLNKYDKIITMTDFARRDLINTGITTSIQTINHPINTNIFKKLDKTLCRNELFKNLLNNKFVVLNTNTNIKRKRLDLTLKAFAEFSKDKDDVFLIMKCPLKTDSHNDNFNLEKLMYNLQSKKLIDASKICFLDKILDKDNLCKLFNCPDVGINTTSGEGWGLTPCEMALCGIPQIVPKNTSYPEIFGSDYDYIKTNKKSFLNGRKNISDIGDDRNEVHPRKDGYILFLQSFPTNLKSHHEFVSELNSITDSYKIIISQYGIEKFNESISNDFKVNLKSIELINKYKNIINEKTQNKILEIYIQIGENVSFLKNNIIDYELLDDSDRKTFQIRSEILFGTYDQYNINIDLPDINDTVRLLNKYYYNRELIKKDGEKCRQKIINNFSIDKICKQFIKVFEE